MLCCVASPATPAAVRRGAGCVRAPAVEPPRLTRPAARAQEAAKNPKQWEGHARDFKAQAEQASIIGHLEMDADNKDWTLHDGSGGTYSVHSEKAWNSGHAPHAHIMTETHVFEQVRPRLEQAVAAVVCDVLPRKPGGGRQPAVDGIGAVSLWTSETRRRRQRQLSHTLCCRMERAAGA